MLSDQVKSELFMKIKSVHKELNKLVCKKNPIQVMSTDMSDICQEQSLQALVYLLDNLMNAGLSNCAWKQYLCKWCLYTGNSFHRVNKSVHKDRSDIVRKERLEHLQKEHYYKQKKNYSCYNKVNSSEKKNHIYDLNMAITNHLSIQDEIKQKVS